MEVVEAKRSIKQLSNSPHFIDPTKEILDTIKTGLDTSWISSLFIKPKRIVMKSLNMKNLDEVKLVEKLQEDLFEQKMVSENLRRQLEEVKEKHKQ